MDDNNGKYTAQEIAKWFLYKNYAEQKEKVASNDDNVYDTYCVFGRNPIIIPATPENDEVVRKIESDVETKNILDAVYDNFSIYTAWQLREMSHAKGSPWERTQKNKVIDPQLIKDYFEKEILE